jgi:uncharacterized protein YdeI (YjbR/CyaY-like superfamily)
MDARMESTKKAPVKRTVAVPTEPHEFKNPAALEKWFSRHHSEAPELWVRMFKKGSGHASVDWNEVVQVSLAWGWIDGIRKTFDEISFVQRLTPRRAKSVWSKKNCAHVERLIADGLMQPSGLVHVEAAKKDGRWEKAYSASSDMEIPPDFMAALEKNEQAKRFFSTLNRQNLYAIYHRLQTARRPDTRERRLAAMIAQLARGEKFH